MRPAHDLLIPDEEHLRLQVEQNEDDNTLRKNVLAYSSLSDLMRGNQRKFLLSGGSMVPRYVLQLFYVKNHKIAKILTTTKAREKISAYFESSEF